MGGYEGRWGTPEEDVSRMDNEGAHQGHPHRHRNAKRRFLRAARAYVHARETEQMSHEEWARMRIAYYALLDTEDDHG